MKKHIGILLVIMLMVSLVGAAGCGGTETTKTTDTAKTTDSSKTTDTAKKKLVVASETTYPPFEMVDDKNGQYIGFDMDLIRAIAESQGYEVEIKSLGFDALIPAVQAGTVDCAISAMSITPERQASVDFSDPYFTGGLVVAVRAENTDIKGKADLKGKTIACEVGTIGLAAAEAIKAEDPSTKVKVFDGVGDAFLEMEKGSADAVINDQPVTAYYIQTTGSGKVKMVGEVFEANDQYGIVVKKGNTEKLNLINAGLKKIKENGKYDEIKAKYFGK